MRKFTYLLLLLSHFSLSYAASRNSNDDSNGPVKRTVSNSSYSPDSEESFGPGEDSDSTQGKRHSGVGLSPFPDLATNEITLEEAPFLTLSKLEAPAQTAHFPLLNLPLELLQKIADYLDSETFSEFCTIFPRQLFKLRTEINIDFCNAFSNNSAQRLLTGFDPSKITKISAKASFDIDNAEESITALLSIIAKAPNTLRDLNLSENPIGDQLLLLFYGREFSPDQLDLPGIVFNCSWLRSLDLSHLFLQPLQNRFFGIHLAFVLKEMGSLEVLNISHNKLSSQSLRFLLLGKERTEYELGDPHLDGGLPAAKSLRHLKLSNVFYDKEAFLNDAAFQEYYGDVTTFLKYLPCALAGSLRNNVEQPRNSVIETIDLSHNTLMKCCESSAISSLFAHQNFYHPLPNLQKIGLEGSYSKVYKPDELVAIYETLSAYPHLDVGGLRKSVQKVYTQNRAILEALYPQNN